MTALQMYFLLKLDNIQVFLACVGGSGLCLTIVIYFLGGVMEDDDDTKRACKRWMPLAIVLTILAVITPTTKQMAAIIVVPKICNVVSENEALKQIPQQIIELSNEWLKELKPQKDGK